MSLQELNQKFPIVDPKTGQPSEYFLTYLRSRSGFLTAQEAAIAALLERQITASGALTGGGPLSDDIDISLDALSPDPAGVFPNATVTIDEYGRVTEAEEGSAGIPSGTAFPGSPADGDRFYRTDRLFEYTYSTTHSLWLSSQVFLMHSGIQTGVGASTTFPIRFVHPWYGTHSIFLTGFLWASFNSAAVTSTSYFTAQLRSFDGVTQTDIGSPLTAQGDTTSSMTVHAVDPNVQVASTIEALSVLFTATGAPSMQWSVILRHRLVG